MEVKLYDVIVIGAGPAGSTAARVAAENGLEVLLLDKEEFPRDKLCGGYLPSKTLRLLKEPLPEKIIEQHIYGVKLYDRRYHAMVKHTPHQLGVTVRRANFDWYLVQQAVRCGAIFAPLSKVMDVQAAEKKDRVHVITEHGIVMARKVILAEGVDCCIAKKAGILKKWRKWQAGFAFAVTVQCDRAVVHQIIPYVELYCIPFLGAFGWVFPLKDELNIGVGSWACQSRPLRKFFFTFFDEICRMKRLRCDMPKLRGSYIPAGGFSRRLGKGNVILAGDCGGFVDPFSGEGVYYAVKSGEIAADEVVNSMTHAGYRLDDCYTRQCKQVFYKNFYHSLLRTALCGRKAFIQSGNCKAEHFLDSIVDIMRYPNAYSKNR